MPRKDIFRDGVKTQFGKGQPTNRGGRKRGAISRIGIERQIKADYGIEISKADKLRILESMIEFSLFDLKRIEEGKKTPAFMVSIAAALREDVERGKIDILSKLFERFAGRPTRRVNAKTDF